MPNQIKYLDGGKGVAWAAASILTGPELISDHKEIFSRDLAAKPYLYAFVDFGDLTGTTISIADMREVAGIDFRASRSIPNFVVAIYAKDDLPIGLARMWQVLAEHTGWESRIFRDKSEAVEWMKERVATKSGIQVAFA